MVLLAPSGVPTKKASPTGKETSKWFLVKGKEDRNQGKGDTYKTVQPPTPRKQLGEISTLKAARLAKIQRRVLQRETHLGDLFYCNCTRCKPGREVHQADQVGWQSYLATKGYGSVAT